MTEDAPEDIWISPEDDPHEIVSRLAKHRPAAFIGAQFDGATDLAEIGPFIEASVSHPDNDQKSADGVLLIDTGARRTSLVPSVITDLCLPAIGTTIGEGSTAVTVPVHVAQVLLRMFNRTGGPEAATPHLRVLQFPRELQNLLKGLTIRGSTPRVLGLLGRDVLEHGTLIYDGGGAVAELRVTQAQLDSLNSLCPD